MRVRRIKLHTHIISKATVKFGLNVEILNPFIFLTKDQMIQNCQKQQLIRETVEDTTSCSIQDMSIQIHHQVSN
jgi:hypothetical protein